MSRLIASFLLVPAVFFISGCNSIQRTHYKLAASANVNPIDEHAEKVREIIVDIASRYSLLDKTAESTVPQTICYFRQEYELGHYIGARVLENSLIIDVGRVGIGGYDWTIPKIERDLEAELEKYFPNQFIKNGKITTFRPQ
jgi:hypothetical protein